MAADLYKLPFANVRKNAKTKPKYVLHPGDIYFYGGVYAVSAFDLMEEYGVDPADCVIAKKRDDGSTFGYPDDALHLYPRADGDYSLKSVVDGASG